MAWQLWQISLDRQNAHRDPWLSSAAWGLDASGFAGSGLGLSSTILRKAPFMARSSRQRAIMSAASVRRSVGERWGGGFGFTVAPCRRGKNGLSKRESQLEVEWDSMADFFFSGKSDGPGNFTNIKQNNHLSGRQ